MAVSIKDVAQRAQVSHSTVSRALQNPRRLNQDTAQRVQQIAREMGYRPNSIGRSLVTRRTDTIGVVVTTVADPFVAEVVAGVEEVAHNRGYAVFLANSNAQPEREISVVRSFHDRRVDGVLVMASRVGSLYLPLLEELNVPIVLVDNQYPGEFAHAISIDDRGGARMAVRHLIELGHRRIGYVADQYGLQSDEDRKMGYAEELESAGLAFSAALVAHGDGKAEGGRVAMQSLLALRDPPTAVFCYNDMTAIGALRTLHSKGWKAPEEMSVVGFDDLPIAQYVEPPLTTVRQPKAEMGRMAAERLLNLLGRSELSGSEAAGGGGAGSSIRVPGELVVRASACRPRHG
ncbi:MAG: LacI family DNA-binding transcriptional regulator [Bryobacteraceae bacterium]